MLFTVGRHIQVLLDADHPNRKPYTRHKYTLACTCSMKRRAGGHCAHTLALFENNLKKTKWRDIELVEMTAKSPEQTP